MILAIVLQSFAGPVELWLSLALASCLGLLAAPGTRGVLLVFLAFLLLGSARSAWWERGLRLDSYRGRDGLRLDVTGTVLESPRTMGSGVGFRYRFERVEGRPELPPATVYALLREPGVVPALGERWRFVGRLEVPTGPGYPGAFDQRAWLRRDGVHHTLAVTRGGFQRLAPPLGWSLPAVAHRARLALADNLQGKLPAREHALLIGIMLGEDRGLDAETREAFRVTGTSHLLAASGLNIAVVVGLVFLIGHRAGFGRHRMALAAIPAAVFYTYLAGCSPSIIRAALMACLGLAALAAGRDAAPSRCLVLACLGALLLRPAYLFEVGFAMSALAVAGILLLSPGMELRLRVFPGWLRSSLAVTSSATVALLPLLLWCFQTLSPIGLLANLIMAPVAELLLPLGLLTGVLAGWSPALAVPFLWACRVLLGLLLGSAAFFATVAQGWVARPSLLEMLGLSLSIVWLGLALNGRSQPLLAAASVVLWLGGSVGPAPGPFVRVVQLTGQTAVWVHGVRGEVLLLQEARQQKSALGMLRVCGASSPPTVAVHPFPSRVFGLGGPRLRLCPGFARYSWRGASFTWVLSGDPVPRLPTTVLLGEAADVPCRLQIPPSGGPWEIRLRPHRVSWSLWE
ncbi:MAG: ComEC/Rec2 family competence protein [Armatimonadetes bacterium]|nr:ComEC/Rec2 family competence protein [Armatimonadota bacterium]